MRRGARIRAVLRPLVGAVLAFVCTSGRPARAQKGKTMRLTARGTTLTAESTEFTAVFEGATLVSVVDRRTGAEFMRKKAKLFPVELYYLDKTTLGGDVGAGV